MNLIFDLVSEEDLGDAIAIEEEGYPADEAASLSSFRFRQSNAGDLFLGVFLSLENERRKIIGYICSTLADSDTLTHESMSNHTPGASTVCIHSVCVSSQHRRQGIALRLLREYLSRLADARSTKSAPYERVLLIAHRELIPLYEKAGFELIGESPVQHGSKPWFEMCYPLSNQDQPVVQPSTSDQLPPGVIEVLSAPRPKVDSQTFASFPNGVDDLTHHGANGKKVNNSDLMCPRCGSVILLKGIGEIVAGPSVQLDIGTRESHALLPQLPTSPATVPWWLVSPSPMKFENIGFSRALQRSGPSGKPMKLLACAECDLGPLGWCEEGGTEFWVAATRVGYGQPH